LNSIYVQIKYKNIYKKEILIELIYYNIKEKDCDSMERSLSKNMTIQQFENQYWYLYELKKFARELGIQNSGTLRKDELERCIRAFLETGKVTESIAKRSRHSSIKDSKKELTIETKVVHYTNDRETKDFLEREAKKIDPSLTRKSGEKYWLNRWLDEQLRKGNKITYGDLVNHLVSLRRKKNRLPQIPSTKFNNFVTDYLEENSGSSREEALKKWTILKELDIPKTFISYKKYIEDKDL
jgi:hypothetical protein